MNFGGYPEVVASEAIRADFQQFVGRDIVQKVLMHDLPSLYGIEDIQELNRLFTALAYNTGQEVNLEGLSKHAHVAKNTIGRYLEYLEAAFLIIRLRRVDERAQRFQRQRHFKVYLTNPSMRAALFGPVTADSSALGALAETATFAQWIHTANISSFALRSLERRRSGRGAGGSGAWLSGLGIRRQVDRPTGRGSSRPRRAREVWRIGPGGASRLLDANKVRRRSSGRTANHAISAGATLLSVGLAQCDRSALERTAGADRDDLGMMPGLGGGGRVPRDRGRACMPPKRPG